LPHVIATANHLPALEHGSPKRLREIGIEQLDLCKQRLLTMLVAFAESQVLERLNFLWHCEQLGCCGESDCAVLASVMDEAAHSLSPNAAKSIELITVPGLSKPHCSTTFVLSDGHSSRPTPQVISAAPTKQIASKLSVPSIIT
jgi:hypothetical protein